MRERTREEEWNEGGYFKTDRNDPYIYLYASKQEER